MAPCWSQHGALHLSGISISVLISGKKIGTLRRSQRMSGKATDYAHSSGILAKAK
jgi:hypothetical protein